MSSGQWTKVPSHRGSVKNKSGPKKVDPSTAAWSERKVESFLSTYKTRPCAKVDFHDQRLCPDFHDGSSDRRRNPFDEYYGQDECLNQVETMYHPALFRTVMCRNANSTTKCVFGNTCSHAHSNDQLRDRHKSKLQYEQSGPVSSTQLVQPAISDFIPTSSSERDRRDYTAECQKLWDELQVTRTNIQALFLPLAGHELFLIQGSALLWQHIQNLAFEDGLARVRLDTRGEDKGLLIEGLHIDSTRDSILAALCPPSQFFEVAKREFGERVTRRLKGLQKSHTGRQHLIPSGTMTHLHILDESSVVIYSISTPRQTGKEALARVLEKIEFWVREEEYDKFKTCGCCLENRNLDEGICCPNNHFYCKANDCVEQAISSQIINIRGREEDVLLCPECASPYDMQLLAPLLSKETWVEVQNAILDKKVEAIQSAFDEELQKKVEEAMVRYGSADSRLKMEAQDEARRIRNTIMNLCCPHCGTVYFDFAGCMALQCATCKTNFCGYCHQKTETSRGAHEHVRQCLMNETSNGSYYATEEEIQKAQRMYRTREIKKHIRQFKKDKQNAIVIELRRDLEDVGIKPEALFEVGNLQDAIGELL